MTRPVVAYTNYTNIDAGFMRPYERGDRLVRGWSGDIVLYSPEMTAEAIYTIHNHDDRPDGQMCPSMSVGDVVIIGEIALSVDMIGFVRVEVDHDDLITDRTWREMWDEKRRAAG